jgi:hypothetical protein
MPVINFGIFKYLNVLLDVWKFGYICHWYLVLCSVCTKFIPVCFYTGYQFLPVCFYTGFQFLPVCFTQDSSFFQFVLNRIPVYSGLVYTGYTV